MNQAVQITPVNHRFVYVIGILFLVGCGESEETSSPTAVVTGKVSYQGSPLAKGTVLFQHSSGQTASADIQGDGSYRLDATQGNNKVAIVSREPDRENPQGRPRIIPGKDLIPALYGEFRTSELMATVEAGENQIDFELQGDITKK